MSEGFDASICICTFRRREGLTRALQSVRELQLPAGCRVEVVVVDNDAQQTARGVVEYFESDFPVELRYFCERSSGVSYARNRCVVESRGEWIVFMDDDEYVDPRWLMEHWTLSRSQQVDAIFGPVLADFSEPPSTWLLESGAYARPRRPTGLVLNWGGASGSGNVMIRRKIFETVGGFDLKLAASGGEDNDFFWRCIRQGARLVWCDTAVAHEVIPATRMTRAWVLAQAYKGGRTYTFLRARHLGRHMYFFDAAWGLASVLIYGAVALLARLLRRPSSVRYERKTLSGLGKLLGWRGPPGNEYARAIAQ